MKTNFIFTIFTVLYLGTVLFSAQADPTRTTHPVDLLENDAITGVNAPESVMPGEQAVVTVSYMASTDRTVRVGFQLDSDPYTSFVDVITPVPAGSGTIDVTVPIPGEIPVANDAYQFQVYITPVGGDWDDRLSNSSRMNRDVIPADGPIDDVISVDAPGSVSPNRNTVVTVTYSASETRELIVGLQLDEDPFTTYVNPRQQVEAGQGTVDVTLRVPGDIPIANDAYQYQVYITPVGGGFDNLLDNIEINDIDAVPGEGLDDDILSVDAPTVIEQNSTVTLQVGYSASTDRDVIAALQLDGSPFTVFFNRRVSVPAGTGTVEVPIEVPFDIPVGENQYLFQTYIVPTGGDYPDRFNRQLNKGISVVPSTSGARSSDGVKADAKPSDETLLYPNPINGQLNVKHQGTFDVQLFGVNGKLLRSFNNQTANSVQDVSGLKSGTYVVKIASEDGQIVTQKLIKE